MGYSVHVLDVKQKKCRSSGLGDKLTFSASSPPPTTPRVPSCRYGELFFDWCGSYEMMSLRRLHAPAHYPPSLGFQKRVYFCPKYGCARKIKHRFIVLLSGSLTSTPLFHHLLLATPGRSNPTPVPRASMHTRSLFFSRTSTTLNYIRLPPPCLDPPLLPPPPPPLSVSRRRAE